MFNELKEGRTEVVRRQANVRAYDWKYSMQPIATNMQRVKSVDVRMDILSSIAPKWSGKGKKKSPFDFQ